MTTTADMFIQYTEDALAVARRLLSRGVTVYAHECSSAHFGSWSTVAGVEQERFQFRWEGRALVLTISQSVRTQGRRDWEPLHTLNVRHPEAVSMMEMFLLERFAAQQIAPPEPPLPDSGSSGPVHRTLDSLPAPVSGGGR